MEKKTFGELEEVFWHHSSWEQGIQCASLAWREPHMGGPVNCSGLYGSHLYCVPKLACMGGGGKVCAVEMGKLHGRVMLVLYLLDQLRFVNLPSQQRMFA